MNPRCWDRSDAFRAHGLAALNQSGDCSHDRYEVTGHQDDPTNATRRTFIEKVLNRVGRHCHYDKINRSTHRGECAISSTVRLIPRLTDYSEVAAETTVVNVRHKICTWEPSDTSSQITATDRGSSNSGSIRDSARCSRERALDFRCWVDIKVKQHNAVFEFLARCIRLQRTSRASFVPRKDLSPKAVNAVLTCHSGKVLEKDRTQTTALVGITDREGNLPFGTPNTVVVANPNDSAADDRQ